MSNKSKSPFIALSILVLSVYIFRQLPSSPNLIERIAQSAQPVQDLQSYCSSIQNQSLYTNFQSQGNQVLDSKFDSLRGGYTLKNYLLSGTVTLDFIYEYAAQLAILSSIGIVLAAFTLCSCYYYCCDCKCFECCVTPTPEKRRCCAFFGIVFVLVVAGFSIAGGVTSVNLTTSVANLGCSFGQVINVFINGNSTDSWIGLAPAVVSLGDLIQNVSNTINTLPTTQSLISPVASQADAASNALNSVYTDYSTMTVDNPNSSLPAITPTIITGLGPVTDSNTILGSLNTELKTKNDSVVSALETVGDAIASFQSSSSSLLDPLNEGKDQLSNVTSTANQYFSQYVEFLTQSQGTGDYPQWGLVGYFGVFAFFALLIFLSMVLTVLCGCDPCNKITGCSWCCISFFAIWGFALSSILLPLAVASQDACDLATQLLTNQTVFDQIARNLNLSQVTNYSDICLFGNGEILTYLGVMEQIDQFKNISNQFIDVSNYTNIPDSYILPTIQFNLGLYQQGLLPVAEVVVTDLTYLNQATDYQTQDSFQNCSVSLDTWVLNNQNCSTAKTYFDQSNVTADFGSKTCIGFEQYQSLQFDSRYSGNFNDCAPVNGTNLDVYINSYVSGFQAHMTSVYSKFNGLMSGLDNYGTANHLYTDAYLGSIDRLLSLNTSIYGLLDTPLLSQITCKFVGTTAILFVNGFCGDFMSNFFTLVWLIFVVSATAVISILPVFCASRVMKKKSTDDVTGIELREHLPSESSTSWRYNA